MSPPPPPPPPPPASGPGTGVFPIEPILPQAAPTAPLSDLDLYSIDTATRWTEQLMRYLQTLPAELPAPAPPSGAIDPASDPADVFYDPARDPKLNPFADPEHILGPERPAEPGQVRPPGIEPPRPPAEGFVAAPAAEPARPGTGMPAIAEPAPAGGGGGGGGRLAAATETAGKALAVVVVVDGVYRDLVKIWNGHDQDNPGVLGPALQGTWVGDVLHTLAEESPVVTGGLKWVDQYSHTASALLSIPGAAFQLAELTGNRIGQLGNELVAIGDLAVDIVQQKLVIAAMQRDQALDRFGREHAETIMAIEDGVKDFVDRVGDGIDQATTAVGDGLRDLRDGALDLFGLG